MSESMDIPTTSGFKRPNYRQRNKDCEDSTDSSPNELVIEVEDNGANEEHSTIDETTFMVTHELHEGLHLLAIAYIND